MAYVQSASAHAAFVSSLPLAFPNANAVTDCLIVDLIWSDSENGGSIAITDSQGNADWTQIFSNACPISGTGYIISSWYLPNCKAGANTITATYTGSFHITAISMAIHEYANAVVATPLDTYGVAAWVQFTGSFPDFTAATTATFTRTKSIETLHSFFACPSNATTLTIPYLFTQRETIASGSYDYQLCTYDQLESAAPIANETTGFYGVTTTTTLIVGAVICLQMIQSPISRAEVGYSWLTINEPVIGLTDRSSYLYLGKKSSHTITSTLRQRGTADISIWIWPGDSYMANPRNYEGCQIYLYDQNSADAWLVFAGLIEQITITWVGTKGAKILKLSCVSFRKCFDALLVPPVTFTAQSAASIFSTLFNTVAGGVPVKTGTINAGFVINQITIAWDRLSDVFDRLAQQAGCIWDIDLTTLTVYLQPPSTTPSPFVLEASQIMFPSNEWNINSQDYRNQQIFQISQGALGNSYEVFPLAGASSLGTSVILRNPPSQITGAWLTKSTEAHVAGSFTGQPSPGDTITTQYPQTGASYNWIPKNPYPVGAGIIDPAGHVQVCVVGNTPGASNPALSSAGPSGVTQTQIPSGATGWNDSGGKTQDGAIIWQDEGVAGSGGVGAYVYVFVSTLAAYSSTGVPLNAQFGNVLIGATLAQTVQNLTDAINANTAVRGQTFSWATWENPMVNADAQPAGGSTSITVRAKNPGVGFDAGVASACSAFSWAGSSTSGGSNGNTYVCSVADVGSSNTSNVYYTPGVTGVGFASLPSGASIGSGWYLGIQYLRQDADTIICEDTVAVNQRAAIENGTGKYQVYASDTTITSGSDALMQCQAALAAFATIPVSFSFTIRVPGLIPGQYLDIGMADVPTGIAALVNGQYLIQEVKAKLIPTKPVPGGGGNGRWMDGPVVPGGGHYEYTITVIDIAQIFSWLEFWKQMGTGGSGGSGSITLNTAPYTPITATAVGYEPLTPGALGAGWGSGIIQPDLALGDSFSLLLDNWTTAIGATGIGTGDATMTVSALPSGVTPASCPLNCIIDYGLSTQEQVLVTAMSGSGNLTWAITRAQWGTTANAHAAAAVITQQFGVGAPIFTGGSIYANLEFNMYLIQDATGNRPNPNWAGGLGAYTNDTALKIQNAPIQFSGNPNTQTFLTIKSIPVSGGFQWVIVNGSSGGALS